MTQALRASVAAVLALSLLGCASTGQSVAQRIDALLPADAILIGEQHDASEHQQLQAAFVIELAGRNRLAALVMEMAERGDSTADLARDATEAQARSALRWDSNGWPWERYGQVVMAAVRRGIPVLGANLPRGALRQAMLDSRFDGHLSPAALARQREAIRLGHCDLLPAERLMPMVRVQMARDASMAAAVEAAALPGKTVLMVAGGGHVARELGVPTHLPASLRVRTVMAVAGAPEGESSAGTDLVWTTPAVPPRDHCADLVRQLKR